MVDKMRDEEFLALRKIFLEQEKLRMEDNKVKNIFVGEVSLTREKQPDTYNSNVGGQVIYRAEGDIPEGIGLLPNTKEYITADGKVKKLNRLVRE